MSTVGATIRSIRLESRLGAGGMGEVFEGFDERLGRRVAVKAIRAARRLDGASKARFAREARMLSRLEHPAVCRLYEFIEGDEGDFLVMELVRGATLNDALARGMSHDDKLRVAEQVADALVAAHAVSVVHRDLKPSNVMVTPDGDAKVLDFGLARPVSESEATSGPVGAAPAGAVVAHCADSVTVGGGVMGTPRFMSPEQAAGGAATAASDMFSFGLLLQELFTGHPAYQEGLTPEEVLHRARWADTVPVAGVGRGLASLIRSLTALRPEQRPTASAAREAIRAIRRRPRRRLQRAAAAAVLASLMLAVLGLGVGWRRARLALIETGRARAQAEAVNRFLRNMLASADPRRDGVDVRVVDILDRAATELPSALGEDPRAHAAILDAIGSTYHALGAYAEARDHLEQALAMRRRELGESHADTLTSAEHHGRLLADQGELDEAERELRATLAAREDLLGETHRDTIRSLRTLASVLEMRGRYDEAVGVLGTARERLRAVSDGEDLELLAVMTTQAQVFTRQGRFADAAELQLETLNARRRVLGDDHPDTLETRGDLAVSLAQMGEYDGAGEHLLTVVSGRSRVLGLEHPSTLTARSNLAQVMRLAGRIDEAETVEREVLGIRRRVLGPGHPDTLASTGNLAVLRVQLGDLVGATELLRSAWDVAATSLGEDHPQTLMWTSNLATVLLRRRQLEEAETLVRDCIARSSRTLGPEHPSTLVSRETLADLLRIAGRLDEAEVEHRRLVEASRRVLGDDHPRTETRRKKLGKLLEATGRAGGSSSAIAGAAVPRDN